MIQAECSGIQRNPAEFSESSEIHRRNSQAKYTGESSLYAQGKQTREVFLGGRLAIANSEIHLFPIKFRQNRFACSRLNRSRTTMDFSIKLQIIFDLEDREERMIELKKLTQRYNENEELKELVQSKLKTLWKNEAIAESKIRDLFSPPSEEANSQEPSLTNLLVSLVALKLLNVNL